MAFVLHWILVQRRLIVCAVASVCYNFLPPLWEDTYGYHGTQQIRFSTLVQTLGKNCGDVVVNVWWVNHDKLKPHFSACTGCLVFPQLQLGDIQYTFHPSGSIGYTFHPSGSIGDQTSYSPCGMFHIVSCCG